MKRATKENFKKSVWAIIKEHGWMYIGMIMTGFILHYYVTTSGGVWPEISILEFILNHIEAFGGLGAVLSSMIVLQNWLRSRE